MVAVESVVPSPVALELTRQFTDTYMYEWDAPKAERQLQQLAVNRDLLQDVLKDVALDELLRPEAIQQVVAQLQRTSPDVRVRTPDELALLLEQVGDLTLAEIRDRAAADPTPWVKQLRDQARSVEVAVRVAEGSEWRWVHAEYAEQYGEFRAVSPERARAWQGILDRYFDHAGPATERDILARYPFPADWLRRELERRLDAGELARGRFSPRPPAGEPGANLTRPEEAGASQYLHRRTLAQIHRQTIGLLRREVRPVPRPVYADFLARWQHLHPAGSLRSSPDSGRPSALVQALQQLRAVPAIGPVWERDILPLRLEDYHPAELESLCQGGELVWIGSGAGAPRRGRVRFLFRGEGSLYLAPPEVPVERLSAGAQAVYGALKAEGALFFADLAAALDMPPNRIEQALLELVMNEWVTNDSLQALRQLMLMDVREPDIGATSTDRRGSPQWLPSDGSDSPGQSTEGRAGNPAWPPSDCAASPGGRPSRPGPAQYRAARRRVAERLQTSRGPASRSYLQVGRWSLVQRLGIMGRERPVEEKADLQARQLLQRWGIVTRTSLEAEEGAWDWQAIASQLALLEMRGEVRRGYFVAGLPGPQYALPEAVEQLRALREGPAVADELADAPVVLNACDPASLYGPEMPDGPQAAAGQALAFARLPSTWWVQWRGWPVIVARGGGAGLVTVQGADEGLIVRALQALLGHLSRHRRHVTARTWNGQPVLESQGRSLLEALGFARDYPAMTWEP